MIENRRSIKQKRKNMLKSLHVSTEESRFTKMAKLAMSLGRLDTRFKEFCRANRSASLGIMRLKTRSFRLGVRTPR